MRFHLFILFLLFRFCFGQDYDGDNVSTSSQIVLHSGIERNDFFLSCGYFYSLQNSITINPSIRIGIIHSFVQANPFMQFGFDSYYNLVYKKIKEGPFVSLGVGGGYSYSFYRKPVLTNFNEIRLSYFFCIGNRFRFFNKGSFGLLAESFKGMSRNVFILYPNFQFSLGLSYVF